MIKNFRINRSNNQPISDNLFCDFQFSLNDKSIQLESVELSELIKLLNNIAETTTYYGTDKYSFILLGKPDHVFNWNREKVNTTEHIVSIISNDVEILNEKIWTGSLHGTKESFYLGLIKQLIEFEWFDLAKKYGNAFYREYSEIEYKYHIADKVKTVLSENVKTERTGYIIGKWYHDKEQSNMYFLLIDGKKYKKRYFERDLELTR